MSLSLFLSFSPCSPGNYRHNNIGPSSIVLSYFGCRSLFAIGLVQAGKLIIVTHSVLIFSLFRWSLDSYCLFYDVANGVRAGGGDGSGGVGRLNRLGEEETLLDVDETLPPQEAALDGQRNGRVEFCREIVNGRRLAEPVKLGEFPGAETGPRRPIARLCVRQPPRVDD